MLNYPYGLLTYLFCVASTNAMVHVHVNIQETLQLQRPRFHAYLHKYPFIIQMQVFVF